MKVNLFFPVFFVVVLLSACNNNGKVTIVQKIPVDSTNTYYVGNRTPLIPSPLIKLPIGSIEPGGWLRKKLELQADGFHGHLQEISKYLVKDNNAWLNPDGVGEFGWEEVPYWLRGYSNCAYVLGWENMVEEAITWLNATINSQQAHGWFGPQDNFKNFDLWPNMIMLSCLRNYYEYAGDQRVLDLMKKYFKHLHAYPDEKFLPTNDAKTRAGDMLYTIYWLYNRLGEEWLLEFAKKTHESTTPWSLKVPTWHNVHIAQGFKEPAIWWMQSKSIQDLNATERNWQKVRGIFGQVPGGMYGSDENCRLGYDDPRQAIETCGMVEEMLSDEILTRITGDLKWADRCENVAFNSLPAAFSPDMKALRYLTAPNMPQSDKKSKSPQVQIGGTRFEMNPHNYRCCQHNAGHGWPYYAQNLWYATPDNGLAAVFYSAGKVTAKVGEGAEVTLNQDTRYPFDEKIVITVSTTEAIQFPLYLRVPGWCDNPEIMINGKKIKINAQPHSYIKISRSFVDGDKITLTLPMKLSVKKWEHNKNSVSVNYGPLTFSLKIIENKVISGGPDKWTAWEIFPGSPWNYGLVLDESNPISNIDLLKKDWPSSNMPFSVENAPLEIKVKARKIPEWQLDENGLVEELQQSPAYTTETEEQITLVPMGCAQIRIAAFPTASNDIEKAYKWKIRADKVPGN